MCRYTWNFAESEFILLARYFIEKFSKRMGRSTSGLGKQEELLLHAYHWPGNVRELQNIIERAVIVSSGKGIGLAGVIPHRQRHAAPAKPQTEPGTLKQLLTEKELRQACVR